MIKRNLKLFSVISLLAVFLSLFSFILPVNATITDSMRAVQMAEDRQGVANVVSYGAKLDGVTDDSVAFSKAIASGKSVYIPPGTLTVTQSFAMPENRPIYIEGAGYGLTTIKVNSETTLPALFTKGSGNILGGAIKNFTVDGNKKVDRVFDIDMLSNFELSGLYLRNFNVSGIRLGREHTFGIGTIKDIFMRTNFIDFSDPSVRPDYGIELGAYAIDNNFINVRISSPKVACILDGGGQNAFIDCHLWGAYESILSIKTTTVGTPSVQQVETLKVEDGSPVARDLTITLDGVSFVVSIPSHDNADINATATIIRNATYTGWTTGGTGNTVTFTCNTNGVKSTPVATDPINYRPDYGIITNGNGNTRVLGCYLDSCQKAGIRVANTKYVDITGNFFLWNNENPLCAAVEIEDNGVNPNLAIAINSNTYNGIDSDVNPIRFIGTGRVNYFKSIGNTPVVGSGREVIANILRIDPITFENVNGSALELNAFTDDYAQLRFARSTVQQWNLNMGADSNLSIERYNSGSLIDAPFKINKTTGAITTNGTWQSPLYLGSYALWVNTTDGKLYIKDGTPTSDVDGTIVGTQS